MQPLPLEHAVGVHSMIKCKIGDGRPTDPPSRSAALVRRSMSVAEPPTTTPVSNCLLHPPSTGAAMRNLHAPGSQIRTLTRGSTFVEFQYLGRASILASYPTCVSKGSRWISFHQ
jgi:hypothetical protein